MNFAEHRCACQDPGAAPPCSHCTDCPDAEAEYRDEGLAYILRQSMTNLKHRESQTTFLDLISKD